MIFSRRKNEEPGAVSMIVDGFVGVALGLFLAVVWLALKPVPVVDAPPVAAADAPPPARHEVVYVSGSQRQVRQSTFAERVKAFAARDTRGVEVPEGDLNRWIASTYAGVDRVRKWSVPPAEFELGMPVFRFAGSDAEVGAVSQLTLLGSYKRKIVVHAKGAFVEADGGFAFVPSRLYVGSCPVPINAISRRIYGAVASVFEPAADAREAWAAVNDVKVEKNRLWIGFKATPAPIEAAVAAPVAVTPTGEVVEPALDEPAEVVSEALPAVAEETAASEAVAEPPSPQAAAPGDVPEVEAVVEESAPVVPEETLEQPVVEEAPAPAPAETAEETVAPETAEPAPAAPVAPAAEPEAPAPGA